MVQLLQFTPAEAAKISGVNVALQRDWRRRGILPKADGQARFDALDVAELLALNAHAERGGPQQAKLVSRLCAGGILYSALSDRHAWGGPFDRAIDWEIDAEEQELEQALAAHGIKPHDNEGGAGSWRDQTRAGRLAERALKLRQVLRAGRDLQACIWWADGSVDFYGGAISALEQVDDERIAGAYTVIDNSALGRVMAARAGRPLATVEVYDLFKNRRDAEAAGYIKDGKWVAEVGMPT